MLDKQPVIDPYAAPIGHPAFLPFGRKQDEGFDHGATIEWRRVISPAPARTARIRFSRPNTAGYAVNSFPALELLAATSRPDAAVVITGLTALGQSLLVPAGELENKFTEADDIVWTKAAHTLHLGASVVGLDSNVFYPSAAAGPYITTTRLPGIDSAPYVEADWKVTSRLTLNLDLGLRWDFTTDPVAPHNTFYTATDYLARDQPRQCSSCQPSPSVVVESRPVLRRSPTTFSGLTSHRFAAPSPSITARFFRRNTILRTWPSSRGRHFGRIRRPIRYPIFPAPRRVQPFSPGWNYYIHKRMT